MRVQLASDTTLAAIRRQSRTILERHGFHQVREHGNHIVMQRVTDQGTTTVPVPEHRGNLRGNQRLERL
ncbi:MAG: type II toxin-antitoxin system HicA family toxin [Planctomycetota bacterium]